MKPRLYFIRLVFSFPHLGLVELDVLFFSIFGPRVLFPAPLLIRAVRARRAARRMYCMHVLEAILSHLLSGLALSLFDSDEMTLGKREERGEREQRRRKEEDREESTHIVGSWGDLNLGSGRNDQRSLEGDPH